MTDFDFLDAALKISTRLLVLQEQHDELVAKAERMQFDAEMTSDFARVTESRLRSIALFAAGKNLASLRKLYGGLVI